MASHHRAYTRSEEIAHAASHALGVLASVVALVWLGTLAAQGVATAALAGALAFCGSALLLFLTSTLYHSATKPGVKQQLRRVDHCAIYVLIAGTYSALLSVAVNGSLRWVLLAVIWSLAMAGIVVELTVAARLPRLSTALYLLAGWAGMVAAKPISQVLSAEQLVWLLLGGLAYTAGLPFYVWKSRRYTHVVWHLFVLLGVTCHFMAVRSFLAGP